MTLRQITNTWKYLAELTKGFEYYAKEEQFKKADKLLKNIIIVYKKYRKQVKGYRE